MFFPQPVIDSDKLSALYMYLEVLSKYLPVRQEIKDFVVSLREWPIKMGLTSITMENLREKVRVQNTSIRKILFYRKLCFVIKLFFQLSCIFVNYSFSRLMNWSACTIHSIRPQQNSLDAEGQSLI